MSSIKYSNLQFLPSGNINSNRYSYHRDETKFEDNNKIFIDNGFEKNIYLKYNNPVYNVERNLSQKHVRPDFESAFEKAIEESENTKNFNNTKYRITQHKRELIEEIVKERDRKIKEKEMIEKKKLEETLIRIIKDSLKFTKENSPITAMMPNKIVSAINEIKEKRKNASSNNLNNLSLGNSFNLSMLSNNSTNQTKYESNAFLKALGLDLQNLTPETIKIDIDEAYKFIKKWRVNRSDINEIIRMKVVNEIMNVEERRSVQKLKKLNQKYDKYIEYKRNKAILDNQIITEKSYDENEYNTSIKNLETENLVNEIKQNYKEEKTVQINSIGHFINEEKKINQSKNESLTANAKSTNYTQLKNRDQSTNLLESNNLISTNFSNSNQINNFSSMNFISPNQTIDKYKKTDKCEINEKISKNDLKENNKSLFEKTQDIKVSKNLNNKKQNSNSPIKKKLDYRLKPKPEIPPKKKRKLVLNSYKNIDRIMKIINNSENLKENENLCKHFRNIRYNKKIDDLTTKLLNANKLIIQNYEEIDLEI